MEERRIRLRRAAAKRAIKRKQMKIENERIKALKQSEPEQITARSLRAEKREAVKNGQRVTTRSKTIKK